jgi:ATP-dependent DNA ligase
MHEIKLDGFRMLARRSGAGVRLLTRRGIDWTTRYPSIAAAVAALACRSCLIDGEVVICGEDGIPVFDRLRYGRQPQSEAVKLGFEGIVSKRLGSPYHSGRSRHWIKSKNPAAPSVKREAEEDWGKKRWR